MATVINIITFMIKYSVNTPLYMKVGGEYYDSGNWREVHKLSDLPTCAKKYWKWDGSAVVEMNQAEKDYVDYVAPPTPPTLSEYKATTQSAIKKECKNFINATYAPETQRSAALHVYPFDVEMTISEFVSKCVAEEDRCWDLVEAATDLAGVDAVTPIWPGVV